ncbi:MAG: thioredoxin-disulfide reductase [Bacillota bacterium]
MSSYDIVIIGGGPAGLASGIYSSRAKLKTVIIEKGNGGGQISTTREIVNYPGFFKGMGGQDLMKILQEHAMTFGTEIIRNNEVVDLDLDGEVKVVKTKKGNEYRARAVILATGAEPRLLNIPGEKKFRGNGVSYCVTCDANLYEGLDVVVVGNGDAAIEEAIYLTRYARKVTVIVIHDEGIVDCNKASAEQAFNNAKIEFVWNSVLVEIKGMDEVESVVVKNLKSGIMSEIIASGVFIYVGSVPRTKILKGKIKLDEKGYIETSEKMETSVEGVYAVGDSRAKYLRQVVTAVSDGAIAAVAAERYILEEEAFKEQVINASKPVLMVFWNPFNEESIRAVSLAEKIISSQGDKATLFKVDVYRNQRLARRYQVRELPHVLLLENGEVIKDLSRNFKDGYSINI